MLNTNTDRGEMPCNEVSPSENKSWELVNFCEFDKYATKSYCAIHNVSEEKNLGDITQVNAEELDDFTMICGGSPCFVAGTKVYTEHGYKNIEDIKIGHNVLTHTGNFKKVVQKGITHNSEIYKIKAQGMFDTFATGNHPYYIRTMERVWDKNKKISARKFSEPIWKQVNELTTNDFIGIPIIKQEKNKFNLSMIECWLIGRYIADGYIRNGKRSDRKNSYHHLVSFCIGKDKLNEFKEKTKDCPYHIGYAEERTVYKARIINERFMNLCMDCGCGAINKRIPGWILDLPKDYILCFLDGYMSGDGCFTNNKYKANSISKELIIGLGLVIQKCYEVGYSVHECKRPSTYIIEGRTVNQHDTYSISFNKEIKKQKHYEVIDNIIWYPIRSVEKMSYKTDVYNIEVEDDHSYTANNAIVHNCQDLSISGKQKGSIWTCQECGHQYNPLIIHYMQRTMVFHRIGSVFM